MSTFSEQRGNTTVNALIVLVLLAAVLHIVFKVAPLYIAEDSFKDEMSSQAALAELTKDEDVVGNLVSKAKDLGIPLAAGGIRLVRNNDMRSMQISAKWDVTVRFFFDLYPPLTTRVFHFAPVVKERYVVKL